MSGKRNPVPREAVDYWLEQVSSGEGCNKTAAAIIGLFPDRFGHLAPDGVAVAIRREMRALGLEAPDGNALRWSGPDSWKEFQRRHPELTIPYEPLLGIASDAHFPVHSEETCSRFLQVVERQQIPAVLFNGDQLHNDYKGHKGIHEVYAAPQQEGTRALAEFLGELMDVGVQRFYFVMGNHDDKPLRQTDGETSFTDWWETQVWKRTSQTAILTCSERYYVNMQKGPNQEYGWRFTHQQNYGQNALTVAKKIANKKLLHTMCGHQHHLGLGKTQSNKHWVVDAGCLADPLLAGYKEIRDSGHPEWSPGFVVLRHGVPELYDSTNPEEWWS